MIEVSGLSKAYPASGKGKRNEQGSSKVMAVDQISFTCKPGRVFSLLGPNGAGKTTTLRAIATILQPTSGQILVDGYDVVQQSKQVRQVLGFLTGSTGLYDRLTPSEVVDYFGRLSNVPASLLRHRKEELFDRLGIHDFASKRIGKLSTGMKQKVSIARTMIHDPAVVVFDEPTSGLDVITANSIIELIKDCRAQGKTVLFSTHIMGEVELLSDDIAIIHEGRLLFNGSFADYRQAHANLSMVEAFIQTIQQA